MKLVKDVLKVEQYRPNPADPSFVVNVTTDVLDHWSRTFNDMKDAQIGIPLTFEHPPKGQGCDPSEWKSGDPRFRAGWVEDVYRDGDTLMAVLDVPDGYASDLVETGCYVSPKFGGTWTDSLSRKWENPIHHIALTTKPVAVNQSRTFTPKTLAFSRDGDSESPFSHEMFFSTSQGQFAQWSQPEDTEVADLSPAEAIDRLFENPNFVAEARQRLAAIPEQQFSADPSQVPPGMPPGMPQGLPEDSAPSPEGDGGGPDAAAVAMQILHEVMQACAAGMKAMAQLGGVSTDDDADDAPSPVPAPAPAPSLQATPAVTAMSRDEIESNPVFAAMEHKLTQTERKGFADRVNALFDSGRCTGPQRDSLIADVGKYEFSRQTEQPNVTLLAKLELLEGLPEHAAIPTVAKEAEFSRSKPTATAIDSSEEMTDERAEEILQKTYGFKK